MRLYVFFFFSIYIFTRLVLGILIERNICQSGPTDNEGKEVKSGQLRM